MLVKGMMEDILFTIRFLYISAVIYYKLVTAREMAGTICSRLLISARISAHSIDESLGTFRILEQRAKLARPILDGISEPRSSEFLPANTGEFWIIIMIYPPSSLNFLLFQDREPINKPSISQHLAKLFSFIKESYEYAKYRDGSY